MSDRHPQDLCALLLRTGAMEGPYRRPRPITLSVWARMRRAVRALVIQYRCKP